MAGGAVVVGSGFAALEIALALASERPRIPVTVISSETEVTYRPWLIHLPAGGPQPPVIPFARLLTAAGVDLVVGRASGADLDGHWVRVDSGTQLPYDQLVVATGAVADRERVPGSREHALFPCDLGDAFQFAERLSSGTPNLAVVFGWERPGPGLEYAAWIAGRRPHVRVTAIDGDHTLERRFGNRATTRVRSLFEQRGARLISDGPVERIGDGTVAFAATEVAAELIVLAAPLRGSTEWLPRGLLDGRAMLRVDRAMVAAPDVVGIGDVIAVPEGYRLPPTLRSIRATARAVARNVAGALRGAAAEPVLRPGQPDLVGPDLAGTALLVRNRRLILSGRLPLLLRSSADRRYLRSRSAQTAGSTSPSS
jgi:NADH dehydrogenase FAD-containing subunit